MNYKARNTIRYLPNKIDAEWNYVQRNYVELISVPGMFSGCLSLCLTPSEYAGEDSCTFLSAFSTS